MSFTDLECFRRFTVYFATSRRNPEGRPELTSPEVSDVTWERTPFRDFLRDKNHEYWPFVSPGWLVIDCRCWKFTLLLTVFYLKLSRIMSLGFIIVYFIKLWKSGSLNCSCHARLYVQYMICSRHVGRFSRILSDQYCPHIQWSLPSKDTSVSKQKCPYMAGVLSWQG